MKFIHDHKVDLVVGGKIYNDYKSKCNDLIGGQTLTPETHGTYSEAVWTMAMTKHKQKNALVAKSSAVYTVMQNKFQVSWQGLLLLSPGLSLVTNTFINQICVRFVLTRNASCCLLKA